MFWKKFYFVVVLLSCNCFLLCCNGFCKWIKEVFGCCQTETTNDSDNGPSDNLNDKNNNINNNNNILSNDNNNINNLKILDDNKSNNNSVKEVENNNNKYNKNPVKEVEKNNNKYNNNPVKGVGNNNNKYNNNPVKEVENNNNKYNNNPVKGVGNNNINNNNNLLNDNNILGNITINDYENNNIQKDKNVIDLSNGFDLEPKEIISTLKCVFLSATDCRVGKTSILNFFSDKKSDKKEEAASGRELFQVNYQEKTTSVEMTIQLWDFSAQKKYESFILNNSYLKGTKAIIFVYDITDDESFNSLKAYIKEVRGKVPWACLFLLGNKLDLVEQNPEKRKVKTEEAKNFANEKILIFLGECSAEKNTYMPGDRILYCTQKGLLEKDGKCTEGLHGMLKSIIWRVHYLF